MTVMSTAMKILAYGEKKVGRAEDWKRCKYS